MKNTYIRVISLLLVAVILIMLPACKNKGNRETTYTADEGLLVYYFYYVAFAVTAQEEKEHNFINDADTSIKDMPYDEKRSWYDVLMERAVDALTEVLTYCNAAAEEGIVLSTADRDRIEENLTEQRMQAALEGYTLDQYLAYIYGNSYVTEAVIKKQSEIQTLALKYTDILAERFEKAVTDRLIEDKLAAMTGERDETLTRNIGVIVLAKNKYESDEDAAAATDAIVEELKSKSKLDLDSFADYAAGKSDSDNHKFMNVAFGDMNGAIDEWLYAAGRSKGDIGSTSDDDAVYIIYYAEDGDAIYIANAKNAVISDMFDEWYKNNKDKYDTGITKSMIKGIDLNV